MNKFCFVAYLKFYWLFPAGEGSERITKMNRGAIRRDFTLGKMGVICFLDYRPFARNCGDRDPEVPVDEVFAAVNPR